MNVGTLTIFLGVTTSGINKTIRDVNRLERSISSSVQSMNEKMLSTGRVLTQFSTFPITVLSSIAAKTFAEFEFNLSKITGLVGIADEKTKKWGNQLQTLSSQVGQTSVKLSEALYFVTTGGIRSAETLDVIATSAKAAATGLGETAQISDIIVSAMNAYGKANLDASRAGDILTMSVREGKEEANKLVSSMGIVFPVASKLGVSFEEVGAGMAAMTRTGTTAATSAMQLRQILFQLLKPSIQAEKALKTMGTSSQELRDSLRDDGLLETLMKIRDMMNVFGEDVVAKVFPNIRALSGVLDILGENLSENIILFNNIRNASGELEQAFDNVSDTLQFKTNVMVAAFRGYMVEWGEVISLVVIPAFDWMTQRFESMRKWLNDLSRPWKELLAVIASFAVVIGPAMILFVILKNTLKSIGAFFGATTTETTKLTKALTENTAALNAQTAAAAKKLAADKASVTATAAAVATEEALVQARIKESAAKTMSARAEVIHTQAVKASADFNKKLSAAKGALIKATNTAAAAQVKYNAALKSGIGVQEAEAAMQHANLQQKRAYEVLLQREAEYLKLTTIELNRKLRAEAQKIALEKASAKATEIRLALEKQEAAILQAKTLQNQQFIAHQGGSLLFAKRINAETLKSVTIYREVTKQTNRLTAAMQALSRVPLGVWLLLAFALQQVYKELTKLSAVEKTRKELADKVAEATANETSELKTLLSIAQNERVSKQMRREAIEKINAIAPEYLDNLRLETINTQDAQKAIEAYTKAQNERFRIEATQEALKEKYKEYTKAVIDGTDANLGFWRSLQAYARFSFSPSRDAGGEKYVRIMDEARQAARERYQQEYEDSVEFLQMQLEDRQGATDAIAAQYAYLETQAEHAFQKEKQYQGAWNQANAEMAQSIQRALDQSETQLEYEERVKKATLDTRKALQLAGAEHEAQIAKTVRGLKEVLDNAKQQKQELVDLYQNDRKLADLRTKMAGDVSKRQMRLYKKEYETRQKQISNLTDLQMQEMDSIISRTPAIIEQLKKLIPETALIEIDFDLKEIENKYNESMRVLERKQLVFDIDDSNLDLLKEKLNIVDARIKALLQQPDDKVSIEQIRKYAEEYNNIKNTIEALEGTSKKSVRTIIDVWNDLDKTLKDITKKLVVFGDGYDALGEQIKSTEKALNESIELGVDLNDKRFQQYLKQYNILLSIQNIYKGNEELLKQSANEAEKLTDIYKKQYGEQNKNIEALEKAQRVLSNYKMEQMFPDLVRITGSVASLEDLEKALKELEERGLTFTPLFKELSKLVETIKIDEDFNDSLAELQRNLEMTATKAELLGTNFNSTEEQLRVYQNSLSRLLRMDISKLDATGVEDWKKAVEEGSEAVRKFILEIELQNKAAELGSDVLWNLGEIAMGVEGAYDNLAKTLTRFTESIMKAILKELTLISIKKLVAKGTKESADAKLKEAAASAVNAAASNAEAGASAANAVAKGVEEGAKLGPAMLVAIPAFLAIILGALTMTSKARQNAAKMAEGGIVPQGFPNDSYPAMLTSGEMVVPPHKLPELSAGKQKIDITVHGKVKGSDIHYIVSEIDRKQRNTY